MNQHKSLKLEKQKKCVHSDFRKSLNHYQVSERQSNHLLCVDLEASLLSNFE